MSDISSTWLYDLLPDFQQNRDYFQGQPLKALLQVFEVVLQEMHGSMQYLYDDWFIETAEEGAVPLIAQLVNCPIELVALVSIPTLRSLAANSISDRRRKGTRGALHAVLRDCSGWAVRVVEAAPLVACSYDVRDSSVGRRGFIDLRLATHPSGFADAFENAGRTFGLNSPRGENLPSFGLDSVDIFVWRLHSYRVQQAQPYPFGEGRYAFHPFGVSIPLFNWPEKSESRYSISGPDGVPAPITRTALRAELDARIEREIPFTNYLGKQPSLEVQFLRARSARSPRLEELMVCDLSNWLSKDRFPEGKEIAIDPESGRLQLRDDSDLGSLFVTYTYASATAFGGGPYCRVIPADFVDWMPLDQDGLNGLTFEDVSDCRLVLGESKRYRVPPFPISISAGLSVTIEAAPDVCPVLVGDLSFICPDGRAQLSFAGIWFDGTLKVTGAIDVSIDDCTFSPAYAASNQRPSIQIDSPNATLPSLRLSKSIAGPLRGCELSKISVSDSLLDARRECAIYGFEDETGPVVTIERSTVFGGMTVYSVSLIADSIFDCPVWSRRTDTGNVRYSFVPRGSRTPAQYHCVPGRDPSSYIRPLYQSTHFAQPGYAQLDDLTPEAILRGAEGGAEMGVFNTLLDPLRRRQLEQLAKDYLPIGMKPVFIFET